MADYSYYSQAIPPLRDGHRRVRSWKSRSDGYFSLKALDFSLCVPCVSAVTLLDQFVIPRFSIDLWLFHSFYLAIHQFSSVSHHPGGALMPVSTEF